MPDGSYSVSDIQIIFVTRPNDDKIVKQEPVEEIIPPEEKDEILNKLIQVL